jgi:hypothetical protein
MIGTFIFLGIKSMNFITLQRDVAAIFYGVLGKQADRVALEYFAKNLQNGKLSIGKMADLFINSQDGQNRLAALDDANKIQYIYHNIHGVNASEEQLSVLMDQLHNGMTLGQITAELTNTLRSYQGDNTEILSQQTVLDATIQQSLFPSYAGSPTENSGAADIQAIYYVLHSTMVPQGINYWGSKLDTSQATINYIADAFVKNKTSLTLLNNQDFVKIIFEQTFKKPPSESDINKYILGLNNHSQSRGDVVVNMINDIRNDSSSENSLAKESFLLATHVYKPGELPENKYQETVAALFYGVAGYKVDATALDVYSKQLAAGMSTADLLHQLATAPAFSNVQNWEQTYQNLLNNFLYPSDVNNIRKLSGNDAYQATSLIIDKLLNGGQPESDRAWGWTYNAKSYDTISNILGYTDHATLTINDSGELIGEINHSSAHRLSDIEIYALRNAQIKVDHEANITINFTPNLETLRITGDKKATLDFSKNSATDFGTNSAYPHITTKVIIENTLVSFIGSSGDDRVIIAPNADMINAEAQIQLGQGDDWLLWQGNAGIDRANVVSDKFKAAAAHYDSEDKNHNNVISANFLTKNIYLTTNENGGVNGVIESNINNFLLFPMIDLAHYKGTGSIYLDGKLVATEGKNVFDFGVIREVASIHNANYANVDHLTQATPPPSSTWNYATGDAGLALTGFADNVTVINVPVDDWGTTYSFRTLNVLGDATANSRIHFDYIEDDRYTRTTPVMDIRFNGQNIDKIDAGTLSFAIKFPNGSDEGIVETITIDSSGSAENTLRLTGDQNAIEAIDISGDKKLNLVIKDDFSTHLYMIRNEMSAHGSLNLLAEKGGTGGGELFKLLPFGQYSAIRSELSGYQLKITDSLESDTINVVGNTTITRDIIKQIGSDTIIFKDSTINSMVTLNTNDPGGSALPTIRGGDKIIVGDSSNPWVFSSQGDHVMTLYGEYSEQDEAAELFASLNLGSTANAFDLFSQSLSAATQGASQDHLSDVGILKLGQSSFIIIDNNANHSFDHDDIVFSLGNIAVNDALKLAHYTPPKIEISGATETMQEPAFIG